MSSAPESEDAPQDEPVVLEAQPASRERALSVPAGARRVVHLDAFEIPQTMDDADRAAYLRRFVTLFVDEGSRRRGGIGRVERATNAFGEQFALKTLVLPERLELESAEEHERHIAGLVEAFREEYACHRALSGLKGFPRLYGFGQVGGVPALVMEWVEGVTLEQARRQLAIDGQGRLSPLTAARIGRDLFELIERMTLVEDGFVHRDISLGNVMVRTSRLSVLEQADEGTFELCLIDFGSTAAAAVHGTSFTTARGVSRKATADYAPPEMLTDDIAGVDDLRKSPSIDVYAGAGVVYDLIAARPPFLFVQDAEGRAVSAPDAAARAGAGAGVSPYRTKTERVAEPPHTAHEQARDLDAVLVREPEAAVALEQALADIAPRPDAEEVRDALAFVDRALAEIVMAGLAVEQKRRPSAVEMCGALRSFCLHYAENVARSVHGEPLIPCTAATADGAFGASARSRAAVRACAKAVSAAVWIAVSASAGMLAGGAGASLSLASLGWDGAASGWAVAIALAAPGVLGLLARWRGGATRAGFARGTAALLASAALVLAGLLAAQVEPAALRVGLLAGWFATLAAGWCPLVVDYALAVEPAGRRRLRAELPGKPAERGDVLAGTGASVAALDEADDGDVPVAADDVDGKVRS